MKLSSYTVLVFVISMFGSVYLVFDDDPFMLCVYEVMCLDESGPEKLEYCTSRLSPKAQEHLLDFFRNKLNASDNATLEEVLELGCQDPEYGALCVIEYYEEKKIRKAHSIKEDMQCLDSGTCMLAYVEQCVMEKNMGFGRLG